MYNITVNETCWASTLIGPGWKAPQVRTTLNGSWFKLRTICNADAALIHATRFSQSAWSSMTQSNFCRRKGWIENTAVNVQPSWSPNLSIRLLDKQIKRKSQLGMKRKMKSPTQRTEQAEEKYVTVCPHDGGVVYYTGEKYALPYHLWKMRLTPGMSKWFQLIKHSTRAYASPNPVTSLKAPDVSKVGILQPNYLDLTGNFLIVSWGTWLRAG